MALYADQKLISQVKQFYEKYAQESNGFISSVDLKENLTRLGLYSADLEFNEMIKVVHSDENGFLDLNDVLAIMIKKMKDVSVDEELLEAFKIFDKDETGVLNCTDLKHEILQHNKNISSDQLDELFKIIDPNGEGTINIEDALRLINTYHG